MSLNHIYRQLALCLRLIALDPKAADGFANGRASALASFKVLYYVVPYSLLTALLAEQKFIAHYNVETLYFLALRLVTFMAGLVLGIMAVYQLCRWQGLLAHFPRWVVSYNWLGVLMTLLMLVPSLITITEALPRGGLVVMGTACYFFALYVAFVHSWRTLQCDIFAACGMAIVPVMIGGVLGDFASLRLYGVVRPFFDMP